jgi:MoxR-like ATPase
LVHGVGKSELIETAAEEIGIKAIVRDLSLMEPPDLVGLPRAAGKTTVFLPPKFLPTRGKGFLVFEELNRCEPYMRAPCLQLLTARKLNDYDLPEGWLAGAGRTSIRQWVVSCSVPNLRLLVQRPGCRGNQSRVDLS